MKILILLLALFSVSAQADEWREADTYVESAFLSMLAIDLMQTHTIASNPDKYFEHNPVLGNHPDSAQVNTYFAATALVHYSIARILPHGWREVFQYVTIGIETRSVVRNFSLGIGGTF